MGDEITAAGIADQHRVILCPPGKNLHRAPNFFVPPNDGVKLALARRLRQVARELLERIIAVFSRSGICRFAFAQRIDGRV